MSPKKVTIDVGENSTVYRNAGGTKELRISINRIVGVFEIVFNGRADGHIFQFMCKYFRYKPEEFLFLELIELKFGKLSLAKRTALENILAQHSYTKQEIEELKSLVQKNELQNKLEFNFLK